MNIIIYLSGLLVTVVMLCEYHETTIDDLVANHKIDLLVCVVAWPVLLLAALGASLGVAMRKLLK